MADITGLTADQIKALIASGGFGTQPSTNGSDFYKQVYGVGASPRPFATDATGGGLSQKAWSGYQSGNNGALAQALMKTDSTGDPTTYLQLDDMMNDPSAYTPGDRLPNGSAAYGSGTMTDPKLAYTMGMPGANQGTGTLMGNDAQKEIGKILTRGGSNPLAAGLGMVGGMNALFPSEANGMPVDSDIPQNKLPPNVTHLTSRPPTGSAQPTRGLGAIGNPAVYSQPTKPAITTYQAALQQAAQQHNTTPEAIHLQLMAQQSPDQRGQAALNAAGMGPGQGGSSGGANGVGSW